MIRFIAVLSIFLILISYVMYESGRQAGFVEAAAIYEDLNSD